MLNVRQCGAEVLITVVYSSLHFHTRVYTSILEFALAYSSFACPEMPEVLKTLHTRVLNPILEFSHPEADFC